MLRLNANEHIKVKLAKTFEFLIACKKIKHIFICSILNELPDVSLQYLIRNERVRLKRAHNLYNYPTKNNQIKY